MKIDDKLHGLTTVIIVKSNSGASQGTGFFYTLLAPPDAKKKGGQWRKVEHTYLVTNRHVALHKTKDGKENLPIKFIFHLRVFENNKIEWLPIELTQAEFTAHAKFHTDKDVDIAIIEVGDLLINEAANQKPLISWAGITNDNLPGKNKINPYATDDAVIIGYPRGYFDSVNLFPILKSGIIASKWGANFHGKPYFLVDAQLFSGSSGSLVISKPKNSIVENGQIFYSKSMQFAFLGIYSGEIVLPNEASSTLGVVWYASLVEEIIKNGGAPF